MKQGQRKKWVNMDLSTNHLSWAAVLDWYYHAVPVVGADREATETVDLVGPLCNSDEVGAHRKMPPLARGDYVAFLDAGGYTEVLRGALQRAAVAGDGAGERQSRRGDHRARAAEGHRRPVPRAAAAPGRLVRAG